MNKVCPTCGYPLAVDGICDACNIRRVHHLPSSACCENCEYFPTPRCCLNGRHGVCAVWSKTTGRFGNHPWYKGA